MISMKEILGPYKLEDQDQATQVNLNILLAKMNAVRSLYGKPLTVTSGLRAKADQIRIYAAKGITDLAKIPMGSKHLRGQAVDFSDPKREFQAWCTTHEKELREIGIWMESFDATKNWVHMQSVPYGSYKEGGSLWFNP